ncbi:MAG: hypothetical protein HFJ25_03645 [Clostridia bacterium]|jgi:hypothetical protein|nr:hypothetical protein [Clostridia bacterium]
MKQKNTIIVASLVLIIIVAALASIFLYNKEHRVNENKEEAKELVKETVSIDTFKQKLKEELEVESETENKECGLIGASEGVSYMIDGKMIQIYKFDLEKSDELTVTNLKKAQEEEKVVMPSFNNYEFKVKYNKGLVLVNSEEHPQEEKIVEIFQSL